LTAKYLLELLNSVVNHILLRCTELRVSLHNLVDSSKDIFFCNALSSGADCEHTCLGADGTDISTSAIRTEASDEFVADFFVKSHGLSVNLEDLDTTLEIGETKLNFTIETTGSGKSRVKCIRSVSSHQDFDVTTAFETIELINYFEHSSLNFTVTIAGTRTSNGINFIKEDNA